MPKGTRGHKAGKSANHAKNDWKKKRCQEYLETKKYQYCISYEGEQTES